jgi:hypothetical protein
MKLISRKTLPLLTSMLLAGLALGMAPLAQAHTCSKSSGEGRWAFTVTGSVILSNGAAVSVAQVGTYTQDREGNLSGRQTRSLGGSVAHETFTGTASTSSNCTGSATIAVYDKTSGALVRTTTLDVVLDDDGNHARAIVTSIVLPDGTSLAPLLTLDYTRIFSKRSD